MTPARRIHPQLCGQHDLPGFEVGVCKPVEQQANRRAAYLGGRLQHRREKRGRRRDVWKVIETDKSYLRRHLQVAGVQCFERAQRDEVVGGEERVRARVEVKQVERSLVAPVLAIFTTAYQSGVGGYAHFI